MKAAPKPAFATGSSPAANTSLSKSNHRVLVGSLCTIFRVFVLQMWKVQRIAVQNCNVFCSSVHLLGKPRLQQRDGITKTALPVLTTRTASTWAMKTAPKARYAPGSLLAANVSLSRVSSFWLVVGLLFVLPCCESRYKASVCKAAVLFCSSNAQPPAKP